MPENLLQVVLQVAPKARAKYLDAIGLGGPLLTTHGINTPLRVAHFLAQALHETGGFTILRENMRYSEARLLQVFGVGRHSAAITPAEARRLAGNEAAIAERVYGLGNPRKAAELGNVQPGDGYKFRGNGILQMTGRGNHARFARLTGVDFEASPELATSHEHALKPAVGYWTDRGLNPVADRNDIRAITKRVNGGYIGMADREKWFDKVWAELKPEDAPAEAWKTADADADVVRLQEQLNALGASPRLEVDGRYGPATRRAVRTFQKLAGINVDGIAGPVTQATLANRLSR